MANNAILIYRGYIEKKLCIIRSFFKQGRQDLVQGVALFDKKHTETVIQFVIILQLDNGLFFFFSERKISIKWCCYQIRFHLAAIRGQHADMRRKIIINFHKAHRYQTVEPCICHALDDILICCLIICLTSLLVHNIHKAPALSDCLTRDSIRFSRADIIKLGLFCGLRQGIFNAIGGYAHKAGSVLYISDQLISRPYSKILDSGFVHATLHSNH